MDLLGLSTPQRRHRGRHRNWIPSGASKSAFTSHPVSRLCGEADALGAQELTASGALAEGPGVPGPRSGRETARLSSGLGTGRLDSTSHLPGRPFSSQNLPSLSSKFHSQLHLTLYSQTPSPLGLLPSSLPEGTGRRGPVMSAACSSRVCATTLSVCPVSCRPLGLGRGLLLGTACLGGCGHPAGTALTAQPSRGCGASPVQGPQHCWACHGVDEPGVLCGRRGEELFQGLKLVLVENLWKTRVQTGVSSHQAVVLA